MRALLLVVTLAGCFNPNPPGGRPCGPDGWCPAPLTCMQGVCGGGEGDDSGIDADTSGPHNRAFLSDPIVIAGRSLADLDAHCMNGAPSGTYVAWFSSDNVNASARLGSKHGWMRPDNKPFANKLSDLLAGLIYYPLRLDKNGAKVGGEVFVATATKSDGAWSTRSCLGAGMGPLDLGVADGTTGTWTAADANVTCSNTVRLYCLQVDHANDVPSPAELGRVVFITKDGVEGFVGLQGLDMHCSMEAGKPALALVATTTASAKSRIPPGMPLVRPDGVLAFDSALNQLAPINVTFDGKIYRNTSVWAGARNFASPGAMGETCTDWLDDTGNTLGLTGEASRSLEESFGSVSPVSCYPLLKLPVRCVVL